MSKIKSYTIWESHKSDYNLFEIGAMSPYEMGIMINNYVTDKSNNNDIKRLISKGANLDVKDHQGETAIFNAMLYDNLEIFKVLIEAGADLSIVNDEDINIIDYIFCYGSKNFLNWYKSEDAQRFIFKTEPLLYKTYVERNIPIHPNIQKEFAHVITGDELNLL